MLLFLCNTVLMITFTFLLIFITDDELYYSLCGEFTTNYKRENLRNLWILTSGLSMDQLDLAICLHQLPF